MKNYDIKTLIEGCIKKDEASWRKFINHFSGLVRWSVSDRLKRWGFSFSSEDIEDISQQVFFSIWEKGRLAEIRDREKIQSWLTIVAGNFAFNYMRNRNKGPAPALESVFKKDSRIEDISDTQSPYTVLEVNEARALIQKFIDKLPPQQQTVLILNYIYEKKHREIAQILKIPVNTVSTIIKRAKGLLKKELRIKGYRNF